MGIVNLKRISRILPLYVRDCAFPSTTNLVKPTDGDELIAEVVRIIAESKIAQPIGSVL